MSRTDRAVARFVGALLMAIGGLITLLSGACTLLFAGGGLLGGGGMDILPWALMFGVPVIAIGLGIYFGGRALHRGPKPSPPPVRPGLEGLEPRDEP